MNIAFEIAYGDQRLWTVSPIAGEILEDHEELLKGYGELLHVADAPEGSRTYIVRFTAEKGGPSARRLAEEARRELHAGLHRPRCYLVSDRDFLAEDGSVAVLRDF